MNLRAHALPLAALFAAALALRLWGIGFGLPQRAEDDCMIPYQVEALYDEGAADRASEREYNWYPLLLARLAALWPEPDLARPGAALAEHLSAAARLHVRTRATLCAIACLAVPLTWLLARLFLTAGWSYFASALVATSLLHLSFSQQARPHAPSAALFLAAVLAAVWVRRGTGWLPHAAAALFACAAVGSLQSGVLCLPALVLGYALRPGGMRRLMDGRVLCPLAGAGAALALFYPFLWRGDFGRRADQTQVFDLAGHMIFLDQFNGRGLAVVARVLWSYEPALLVLCALAAVLAVVRRGRRAGAPHARGEARDAWIALSFALPYLLVCGLYERTYERFLIALVPYAAVAAAFGARGLAGLGGLGRSVPAPAVACLALALPALASLRLAAARAAPDTLAEAARWVAANVAPAETVLLTSKVDLPLGHSAEGLHYPGWSEPLSSRRYTTFLPWSHYLGRLAETAGPAALPEPRFDLRWLPVDQQAYLEDAAGFIAARRADYAVAEVFGDGRLAPVGPSLTAGMRAAGELVARISPDARSDRSEHPFGYQEETSVESPNFTLRALQARCTGPVLEVYRLAGSD
jgi:hypothetical protein